MKTLPGCNGRGDSFTYAVARASREIEEVLKHHPQSEHSERLDELASQFFLPLPVLLAADLIAIGFQQ